MLLVKTRIFRRAVKSGVMTYGWQTHLAAFWRRHAFAARKLKKNETQRHRGHRERVRAGLHGAARRLRNQGPFARSSVFSVPLCFKTLISAGYAMYEVFEHTADLGLRVRADRLETLFAEAGKALFSTIVANLEEVRLVQEQAIELESDQVDFLLFDWLSELLYQFETQGMLFAEFEVTLDQGRLVAKCRGERADPERHDLDHEVKAITYHDLRVEETADGWLAEVIVDI